MRLSRTRSSRLRALLLRMQPTYQRAGAAACLPGTTTACAVGSEVRPEPPTARCPLWAAVCFHFSVLYYQRRALPICPTCFSPFSLPLRPPSLGDRLPAGSGGGLC